MRFREIELVRYGGFADRLVDFGDGRPDLHLIVGPNEAGKSTMLQAIGDFLFGIGGQTPQGWRWNYGDLRIRAVLEHEERTIEAVRRKGNKDTLLAPDGSPLTGEPLGAVLAGLDRAAFERMFGLDHQRLREGGEAILRGRDDAARITLEAGTGVAGIGREMDRFAGIAADLFKVGGSVPLVNRLMRERGEAQKLVRDTTISEARWADHRRRLDEAEANRQRLIEEADRLDREAASLDRLGRARAPLARLSVAKRDLAQLGPDLGLPANAAERLQLARSERRVATELAAGHREDLRRTEESASALTPSPDVLAVAARIEALEARRPVIEAGTGELQGRLAERERADERIEAARRDARLPAHASLPGPGWRRRAAAHLQERREAAVATRAAATRREELHTARDDLAVRRAGLADVVDASELVRAIEALPPDWMVQLSRTEADAARKRSRTDEAIRSLSPWSGGPAALVAFAGPGPTDAAVAAKAMEGARADALAARREADAHAVDAVRAENRLAALAAAGVLPTAEAVAAARAVRDRLLENVAVGDAGAADALRVAVADADRLADRRDAEAGRVAEYGATTQARDGARNLERGARSRLEARQAEIGALEQAWSMRLTAVGFGQAIAPGDYAGWLDRRTRAIEADGEARGAGEAAETLRIGFERARATLRTALTVHGVDPMACGDEDLLAVAQLHHRRAMENALTAERLDGELAEAERTLAATGRAADQERADASARDAILAALLSEAGLGPERGETGLLDAVAAMEGVAEEVVARSGLERGLEEIVAKADAFGADVAELLASLGREMTDDPPRAVAALAEDLRAAMRARDGLATLDAERRRLAAEAERAGRRTEEAQRELDDLMRLAAVTDEDALGRAVAAAERRRGLMEAAAGAEAELVGLDAGAGVEALEREVAEWSVEDEAVGRRRIEERRTELATEREGIGRALAEADEVANRASRDCVAAEAQQAVAEGDAALAAAAEAHVEAAAAGALLRWVLERHRQANQAPLIAAASELFATVTGSAFSGLRVEYGEDDRPSIRAVRADGGGIGVEALSEGTRDQLYLSLRLGSIACGTHPLPIVCDDLLITADDARAAAMLRVLAAASSRNQVILFTHHHHLVDVAKDAIGRNGFVLHRLGPESRAAA